MGENRHSQINCNFRERLIHDLLIHMNGMAIAVALL